MVTEGVSEKFLLVFVSRGFIEAETFVLKDSYDSKIKRLQRMRLDVIESSEVALLLSVGVEVELLEALAAEVEGIFGYLEGSIPLRLFLSKHKACFAPSSTARNTFFVFAS